MPNGEFRLRNTPELATDAELSGLFRVLEDMRDERELRDDDNAAERTELTRQRELDEIPAPSSADRARRAMLDAGFDL